MAAVTHYYGWVKNTIKDVGWVKNMMGKMAHKCSVCSASDYPTNVGFREICRISSDIEPFCVNSSDFGQ